MGTGGISASPCPDLWLQWDTTLSWGTRGALSPVVACAEEVAAACSLPAGPRAEGSLGGPRGVGAGHPALAVSAARPVQAVPPASTHHWAPQHRVPPRGAHRQRHDAQFPGRGPSGTAPLRRALGGRRAALAELCFAVPVTFQCKKPLLGDAETFCASGKGRWVRDGDTGRRVVCQRWRKAWYCTRHRVHTRVHTDWGLHICVPGCHLQRLLPTTAADTPGPVPLCSFGTLSIRAVPEPKAW